MLFRPGQWTAYRESPVAVEGLSAVGTLPVDDGHRGVTGRAEIPVASSLAHTVSCWGSHKYPWANGV